MGKIILNDIEYGIGTPNISNVDTTNLVKKDSIVTAIDDTCTDEQVPSAKTTINEIKGLIKDTTIELDKTFSSSYIVNNFIKNVTKVGNYAVKDANDLSVGFQCGYNLINAPNKSGYVYYLTLFFDGNSDYRVQLGFVINSYDIYIRFLNRSAWSEWKKIALTT